MKRRIIEIDKEKCNGCGACAAACHEGAIAMVDGKAQLMRDDYCDGLGDCLPTCPTAAIRFVEREAAAYDEKAVQQHREQKQDPLPDPSALAAASQLAQWPVQLRLVPMRAPYYQDAHLLIAADCTAYAYAAFHEDFMKGRITFIACPKLDPIDYSQKLTEIFRCNDIRDITLVRMEVPCCAGLERAVRTAMEDSGKDIPLQVVILPTNP